MYKRYKNASLSKILLIDYHSSQTQWSSVLLFISWAAVGGNIFLKVSTILFSFQIHSQGFFSNTQLLLCLSRFLVLSPVFMHSFSARLAQLRLWNPLCWVSLALTWSEVLSLGRHLLWLIFFSPSVWKKIQSICFLIWFLISLVQKELRTIMVEWFRYNFCLSLCLLNFWWYESVLWSHFVSFAVFWLASAILYLLIWLCIHFPPKSVLWQFSVVMVSTSLEFS